MSSWAIVAIVAIGVWGVVQMVKARHGITTDKQGNETRLPQDDPEARKELEELRERVKVLERITVDGREARAIADEIESLRGKPDKQDG